MDGMKVWLYLQENGWCARLMIRGVDHSLETTSGCGHVVFSIIHTIHISSGYLINKCRLMKVYEVIDGLNTEELHLKLNEEECL